AGNDSSAVGLYSSALVVEVTAPTVTGFSPADEASGVAVGANLVVTFSEAVQRGAGTITVRTAEGAVVASYNAATSPDLAFSGSQLTINPAADLAYGAGYVVELAAGSVKDLAGNAYAGSSNYNFSTATGLAVNGSGGADSLSGSSGNDTVSGGAGIDSLSFTGNRSQYTLTKTASGYQSQDNTPGRDGTDALTAVEILRFADSTVDLTMAQKATAITPAELKTLEELYVGFFNRVPEAAGLAYWIAQVDAGTSLTSVADHFYEAGVDFEVYDENMSEDAFITAVYANVLGRSGSNGPTADNIVYWKNWLHAAGHSNGGMVLQMLSDSHEFFTGDPEVGWVIELLDNKSEVAEVFAIAQGLTYNDPQVNIARGIEIAAAITPTDTSAAIALIGVNAFEA
ncbi:MAG TPA: Ig-like domain-containing protein, partial [Ramlibacter sp.]|nr:Ig-like domain-containing protein [Ramlibacter sp.]